MGRCRTASRSGDDDQNQRSKRKRDALNAENLDTSSAGMGIPDGKVPLYHCNYCNKDISGKIRVKCVVCQDFDLCIECFSVGAELAPHKSNHPYRVMDNLSFPLICPDWSADEEMLLLEAIDTYGFGNWTNVADNVGTKSKSQCIDHYNAAYMNSPSFPIPDLSLVMGKNKEELLAMAKGHQVKKEFLPNPELTLKEEPLFSDAINSEESKKAETTNQTMSKPTSGCDKALSSAAKKASIGSQKNDGVKIEESQSGRSVGEKKPKLSGEHRPSLKALSGYNAKRGEFDIEYDNDAEQILAEMEFKDTDTEAEREKKLEVLRIYGRRLDERKRRKNFILERNLLSPDPIEKYLSPEERQICDRLKVFMRYHSKEEHEHLLKVSIEEHRLIKRIEDLKEARMAGCVTGEETDQFIEQKRKKDAPASSPDIKDAPAFIQDITRSLEEWDISNFEGAEFLSESEIKLCNELQLIPPHFLRIKHFMSIGISEGNITKKSDAYPLFKFTPWKLDVIYDMLVAKGVGPQA